ncbi:MAG TPA: protein-L-isoaspartate(D-aspartate) O-methyltransferase [Clostridiales bacterium]|nr:MAG: Protein-L-isoaspartate O-methyltransferase [Firmicutes bacterium ADurb.Bin262]HOU09320.1 protein-L-isoaspartate(D-aspartate) O-methyltransferase [Clostridiales bacterium]HQH63588.1 protein-L-isoaspartate(D-aspartate) O-methyltransferase [Clostridiales bacterium]HQK73944.1 protein-L-isoaspartate(D-aspartate) O-methyltransferase [Clostridiales bacterium]
MDDEKLRAFFRSLDRSLFVEGGLKPLAPLDRPLPIGFGQTVSQPTLVLDMTAALELDKNCRVLEIGTGSGYQTTFLAEFAGEVFTVERIPELSLQARERLARLGYSNIRFRTGDGSLGWAQYAPYDRIIVTAAAGSVPPRLIAQLKNGGRMLIPVGPPGLQELTLVTKDENGAVGARALYAVTFVELVGDFGWGK